MKLDENTILIGGLPHPIGGVTTFLSRLSQKYSEYIIKFVDLYPNNNKVIPSKIKNKYILAPNKYIFGIKILYLQLIYKDISFFFNFSTAKSLVFFLFLPKIHNKWSLMLHHGSLAKPLPMPVLKHILSKFDVIYALNDRQEIFYKSVDNTLPIIRKTSYVPATLVNIPSNKKEALKKAKELGYKIVIGSGYPIALYQHHLLIDILNENKQAYLFIFLYGNGDLKDELSNYKHPRLTVFVDQSEDVFNYYLANSDLYIRPTLEDSFGIACADAIEFGVPVIASNVCVRYNGAIIYNDIEDLMLTSNKLLKL